MGDFIQNFDIVLLYMPRKYIGFTMYRRNGVYELVVQSFVKGIKGIEQYKDDLFFGNYTKRIVFKRR